MVAFRCIAVFTFLATFFAVAGHADIVVGSERADVIQELGKPSSTARLGAREILTFPKKIRIELEAGRVVDIKGYVPPEIPAPAKAAVPESKASDQPTAELPPPPAPTTPPPKPPVDEDDFNPAVAANALGDEVAKMETAWGGAPPPAPPHQEEFTSWLHLAISLVLRFGYTLVALRLGFKYWEMDAFWSGTLAIAAIDAVIHGILIALGPVTEGFTTLGGVENAIPAFVMIFTIRHFCFNKRIQNAVLTAGIVTVFAMLCDIFISIALLNAAFG
jgi:hypothetical protein